MSDGVKGTGIRLHLTGAGRVVLLVGLLTMLGSRAGFGRASLVASVGSVSLLAVAAFAARSRVGRLSVSVEGPAVASAGNPFVVSATVRNDGGAPAHDLLIAMGVAGLGNGALVTTLPALSQVTLDVPLPARRRGRHALGGMVACTTYPLGLVECRLSFSVAVEALILPRVIRLPESMLSIGAARRADFAAGGRRGDDEFHSLRDHRAGESLRAVHWKLSARRGRLLTREFRGASHPPIHVFLTAQPAPSVGAAQRLFESAVTLAASLCAHYARAGQSVRLTIESSPPRTLEAGRGAAALGPILRALAEVVPGPPLDPAERAPVFARAGEQAIRICVGGGSRDGNARLGMERVIDVADRTGARVRRSVPALTRAVDAGAAQ